MQISFNFWIWTLSVLRAWRILTVCSFTLGGRNLLSIYLLERSTFSMKFLASYTLGGVKSIAWSSSSASATVEPTNHKLNRKVPTLFFLAVFVGIFVELLERL